MQNKGSDSNDVVGGFLIIQQAVHRLKKKRTTLGRNIQNDCVINIPTVSRQHAEIVYENDVFVIYDLNSTGGTFVNNKKIEKAALENGDIILLGKCPILFMYDDPGLLLKHDRETGNF